MADLISSAWSPVVRGFICNLVKSATEPEARYATFIDIDHEQVSFSNFFVICVQYLIVIRRILVSE